MNRRPLQRIYTTEFRKREKGKYLQMRGWTKVLLPAALLAAFVLGMPAAGHAEPVQKGHVQAPGVKRLVVEDGNAPIDRVPSRDENTRVEYMETRLIRYEIAREGDTLSVTMHDSHTWYHVANVQDSGCRLVVHVPESLMDASLHISNAGITVEMPRGFSSLDLLSSNGKIFLRMCGSIPFICAPATAGSV